MPGTIQVTVLEFKGASSSSQPSAKSLKVSLGKRYHQSCDKGDFSFPVTKIKENLAVTLLDAGENEIAHADISTIHIIEKGYWDEVFSLEGEGGGGHVHMKLQFILNEDERKRIRVMRESAVKKNETSPITDPRISERNSSTFGSVQSSTHSEPKISDSEKRSAQIDIVRQNDEALQADSPLKSAISFVESPYSYEEQERRVLGSAIPVKELMLQIEVKGTPSSPVKHETEADMKHLSMETEKISFTISEEKSSVVPKVKGEDTIRKPQNEVSLKKPPTNVRKMISAFENSQAQETQPPKRAPKLAIQPADQSLKNFKDLGVAKILHQTPFRASGQADAVPSNIVPSEAPTEPTIREMEKSTFDVMGRQSTLETVTNLRRINEEQFGEVGSKSLTVPKFEVASNEKPKSLEYCKGEEFSSKSSGMWIFPDNRRHLCITTAGERVTRTLAHQCLEAKPYKEKEISEQKRSEKHNVLHGTMDKIQNRFSSRRESGSCSSPDVSPNGLVGQVIKVVAILGFGVLVFLTRQKEPRKNREDKVSLFTVPDYIDGMPFTEP